MLKSWIRINDHIVDPGSEPELNSEIFDNLIPDDAIQESTNYITDLINRIEQEQSVSGA